MLLCVSEAAALPCSSIPSHQGATVHCCWNPEQVMQCQSLRWWVNNYCKRKNMYKGGLFAVLLLLLSTSILFWAHKPRKSNTLLCFWPSTCVWLSCFSACWYYPMFFFFLLIFVDCEAPFVYSACGAPCEKQCALQGHEDLCLGVKECTPGCYCPQVNIELAKVYFIFYRINQSVCFTIIYW